MMVGREEGGGGEESKEKQGTERSKRREGENEEEGRGGEKRRGQERLGRREISSRSVFGEGTTANYHRHRSNQLRELAQHNEVIFELWLPWRFIHSAYQVKLHTAGSARSSSSLDHFGGVLAGHHTHRAKVGQRKLQL